MVSYGDFHLVYGIDSPQSFEGCSNSGFRVVKRGELASSLLVLDSEKGELVRAPAKSLQKGITGEKALAALKSHSEAEKRRRERINSHLSALRQLVPSSEKMDKASLLAEVINHVKELKRNETEINENSLFPTDFDEIRVESYGDEIRASLCCEDRPELLSNLKQTLQSFNWKTVKAEMSTTAGRVKNIFVVSCDGKFDDLQRQNFAGSVQKALKSVLESISSSDYSPRSTISDKRRRIPSLESLNSSSSEKKLRKVW